jgi:hypothetical protein
MSHPIRRADYCPINFSKDTVSDVLHTWTSEEFELLNDNDWRKVIDYCSLVIRLWNIGRGCPANMDESTFEFALTDQDFYYLHISGNKLRKAIEYFETHPADPETLVVNMDK